MTASALAELLLDRSALFKKPKGTPFRLHLFITRGDSCKPIAMGEVPGGIKRLDAHPSLPPDWPVTLHKHEEELANMSELWDWPACRWWSEMVLQRIDDGRLKGDWAGWAAIKELQRVVWTDAPCVGVRI